MEHYRLNNLDITLEREGAKRFTKASYPIRYGRYSEIETREYLFQFNLNGDIKYIRGLNQDWPHPAEWLKRTEADDWVYYLLFSFQLRYSFISSLREFMMVVKTARSST